MIAANRALLRAGPVVAAERRVAAAAPAAAAAGAAAVLVPRRSMRACSSSSSSSSSSSGTPAIAAPLQHRRRALAPAAAVPAAAAPSARAGDASDDDDGAEAFAVALARVCDETKAQDLVVLHVAPLVSWTSYFVIATVTSKPQLLAVLARAEATAEGEFGRRKQNSPGSSPWEVLDYGDVVLHVFTPEQREAYDVESFYAAAEEVALPFGGEGSSGGGGGSGEGGGSMGGGGAAGAAGGGGGGWTTSERF